MIDCYSFKERKSEDTSFENLRIGFDLAANIMVADRLQASCINVQMIEQN